MGTNVKAIKDPLDSWSENKGIILKRYGVNPNQYNQWAVHFYTISLLDGLWVQGTISPTTPVYTEKQMASKWKRYCFHNYTREIQTERVNKLTRHCRYRCGTDTARGCWCTSWCWSFYSNTNLELEKYEIYNKNTKFILNNGENKWRRFRDDFLEL